MAEKNSREISDYKLGQWTVSERENSENDRVDEGDHPENGLENGTVEDAFEAAKIPDDSEVDSLQQEFAKDVLIF